MKKIIKMISLVAVRVFESEKILTLENLGEGLTSKVYKVIKEGKNHQENALKVIDKHRLNS